MPTIKYAKADNPAAEDESTKIARVAGGLLAALLLVFAISSYPNPLNAELCPRCGLPLSYEGCRTYACDLPVITTTDAAWPTPRRELTSEATTRWKALHAQLVETAEREGPSARVVFLGDSITEGWLRTGFSATVRQSTPQPACERIWQEAFGRWKPLNFGVGGDRVQDLGWRLQHGLLPATLQPDVFVVLVGTNDLGRGETASSTLAELGTLLSQLHEKRPDARLVLQLVFPRGSDEGEPQVHVEIAVYLSSRRVLHMTAGTFLQTAGFHRSQWWEPRWNGYHARVAELNRGIEEFARGKPWVRTADCGAAFLGRAVLPDDQLAHHGEPPQQGRRVYIRPEMMYDLLHLTPLGYQAWAECLSPHLVTALQHAAQQGGREGGHHGAHGGGSIKGSPLGSASGGPESRGGPGAAHTLRTRRARRLAALPPEAAAAATTTTTAAAAAGQPVVAATRAAPPSLAALELDGCGRILLEGGTNTGDGVRSFYSGGLFNCAMHGPNRL